LSIPSKFCGESFVEVSDINSPVGWANTLPSRPLTPYPYKIKESRIHGLGVFCNFYQFGEGSHIFVETLHCSAALTLRNYLENVSCEEDGKRCTVILTCPVGRFLNHSNTPNCVLKWHARELYLVATEVVRFDQEFTIDYGPNYCLHTCRPRPSSGCLLSRLAQLPGAIVI
jgi:hypothetical protein